MMAKRLDFYISGIEERIRTLYDKIGKNLMLAMDSFKALDSNLANKVKQNSAEIEELANKIEENVFETIARRQPVARDLRRLASYLHVSYHLFRIGRYSFKIAHITTLCENLEHFKELQSLPHLAELAVQCLKISEEAILDGNLERINQLEELEAESDRETEEMFIEIAEYLRKMDGIERMAMYYIIIGRYYERAADQAFQMAERGIYIVTGEKRKLGKAFQSREWIGPH